jgi:hypothetical protein
VASLDAFITTLLNAFLRYLQRILEIPSTHYVVPTPQGKERQGKALIIISSSLNFSPRKKKLN